MQQMKKIFSDSVKSLKARSLFIAEHIDLKTTELVDKIASNPLVIKVGTNGCVALFRYGAVVFFNTDPVDEAKTLAYLKPFLKEALQKPVIEESEIIIDPNIEEDVRGDTITLKSISAETVQIIADVLSKTVVLEYYEESISQAFDSIEPFARGLKATGRCGHDARKLLSQIGGALLSMHKMIGRVQINDKLEVLWYYPVLERIYARLQDEYELKERHLAVEQKLELISSTAETVLDLLNHNHSSRLEWYVIVLIIIEIFLSLYELFLHPLMTQGHL